MRRVGNQYAERLGNAHGSGKGAKLFDHGQSQVLALRQQEHPIAGADILIGDHGGIELAHAKHQHLALNAVNVDRFERIQQTGVEQAGLAHLGEGIMTRLPNAGLPVEFQGGSQDGGAHGDAIGAREPRIGSLLIAWRAALVPNHARDFLEARDVF